MKTGTKIAIGLGSTLLLGVIGVGIYVATRKKDETPITDGTEDGDTGTEDGYTGTENGNSELQELTSQNTLPNWHLNVPTVGGEFEPKKTLMYQPTSSDYIRMADRWMTWENVWRFANKLGITDKDAVGGGENAYENAIITPKTRMTFDTDITSKFPGWKKLLKRKAATLGIPVLSKSQFENNTDAINELYGLNLSYFSGKTSKDFWRG